MEHFLVYILAAGILGLVMTWGVGANDLANIMSTTMGSKAISVRQAMLIAIIFEFAGAFFGGANVTATIRTGIINSQSDILIQQPHLLIYGMLAVLMSGTVCMLLASFLGLPVSITNAIVGALVGFGAIVLGVNAIHWQKVIYIAISWVSSPLIAGIVAYFLFRSIQSLILSKPRPVRALRRAVPIYLFLIGIVLSIMVIIKGLRHFGYDIHLGSEIIITILCSVLITLLGLWIISRIKIKPSHKHHPRYVYIEKVFGILMAFTACAMVFAHGSNDVAIATGPVVAIVNIVSHGGRLVNTHVIGEAWVILLGCTGVVLGLLMYGKKVIQTVGTGITALTPSRAFAATIAAATTVVISTGTGIPVSATQTLVGAVFGVGLARGIGALNLTVIRNILFSWIITLPAASALAIVFYLILRLFGAG
ncbi:MAG: inorganic phosphate transporter [Legionellales bacterium]|nr:inorganic phosphate transporter [Legionellales bacterium]